MLPTIFDLINVLNSSIFKTQFYAKCMDYLKAIPNKQQPIYEINNDAYFLEPLRLHLLRNNQNIFMHLATVLPEKNKYSYAFRELKMSPQVLLHVLKQLEAIRQNSMIALCPNLEVYDVKYVIFTNEPISNTLEIPINYANLSLLLGIKSLDVLEYQNLDRLCDTLQQGTNLTDFYRFHDSLTMSEKERILVLVDATLTTLGLFPPPIKIELIYAALGENHNNIQAFKQKIRNQEYISNILYKERGENKNGELDANTFNYFTRGLPMLDGVLNIYDVIADPTHHFHFMGIKFISLELITKDMQKQARTQDYVNLLALGDFNNYETKICFPNLSIQDNKAIIYDDKFIKKQIDEIIVGLKDKYDISMTKEELQNEIFKCRDAPFEIYDVRPLRNKFTNEIIAYHTNVMNYYIKKYFDKNKLLDIGAGPLRQIEFYEKAGFKHLIAIEPSKESIKTGLERFETRTKTLKLDFILGLGDELWTNNEKYESVIRYKPYKSILFKFTIHYMIKTLDVLIKNLLDVMASDTHIIISCIDGTKLMNYMKNTGKYEVKLDDDTLLYGVYDFPSKEDTKDYKQIMIYFKGVYGVESGSIEYIVNINYLITRFEEIGFKVILSKNFMEIDIPELVGLRENFNAAQKSVSELHHVLVLSNGKSGGKSGGTRGYKYKYKKYKTKYYELDDLNK